MRRALLTLGLFIGSAAIPMILVMPRRAYSGVRTIAANGGACAYSYSYGNTESYTCSIPAGSDFQTANLTGMYADFNMPSAQQMTVWLGKLSYTGSSYADYRSFTSNVGANDQWVGAVNVKTNASVYDYVYGWLYRPNATNQILQYGLYGMAPVTSP